MNRNEKTIENHALPASRVQKPVDFPKFGENRRNQVSLNFKTDKITVHCFKILEKDKN
jgi:hypothetical protein